MASFFPENHEAPASWELTDGTVLTYQGHDLNDDIVFAIDNVASPKALNPQQFHDKYAPLIAEGQFAFSEKEPCPNDLPDDGTTCVQTELIERHAEALRRLDVAIAERDSVAELLKSKKKSADLAGDELYEASCALQSYVNGGVPADAPLFAEQEDFKRCGTCGNIDHDDEKGVDCCAISQRDVESDNSACENWTDEIVEEEADDDGPDSEEE